MFNYDELDPGIRDLVRALHTAGYKTCDSGDGVSKPADWYTSGCAMPFKHVACVPKGTNLVAEAHRLAVHLPEGWTVEASYSTHDASVVLLARELSEEER